MFKVIGYVIKSLGIIFRLFFYCVFDFKKSMKESRLLRYYYIKKEAKKLTRNLHMDLIVSGMENLPSDDSYLITPNHQSLVDAVVFFNIFDDPIAYVAKDELNKVPEIGKLVLALEGYFLERDNLRQEIKVMKSLSEDMQVKNIRYIIFPEGTRSKDKDFKLNEFKAGAFKYPMNNQKKIVPCAIYGTGEVLNKHTPLKKKYPIYIHFFKPLDYEFYKDKSSSEVSLIVQNMIDEKVQYFRNLSKK